MVVVFRIENQKRKERESQELDENSKSTFWSASPHGVRYSKSGAGVVLTGTLARSSFLVGFYLRFF